MGRSRKGVKDLENRTLEIVNLYKMHGVPVAILAEMYHITRAGIYYLLKKNKVSTLTAISATVKEEWQKITVDYGKVSAIRLAEKLRDDLYKK